ncbi:MAG: hypothetical protein HUU20_11235 [Pirellulales bacterium]|nr:hypothetical protein [Pirellulales bacterium]
MALEWQAAGLAAALQPIAADAAVQTSLRQRNADGLLVAWRPVFERPRRENHITHFYFFDVNRVCLLRVHKPEKRGDTIDRFTALEAVRTGKTASGIELGPLGTFTLRVVQPVFAEGNLVGYVELGKEIEDVLQSIHARSGNQLAVVIRKGHLNRQSWEEGMRLLGREADWNRLPRSVISYASQGRLPDAFTPMADHAVQGGYAHRKPNNETASDGQDWRISSVSLQDASGKEVGDLLVMTDMTAENTTFRRMTAVGSVSGGVLLAGLLGFLTVLLGRTDAGIRAQREELLASEEHLSATLRSIGDGVIACDREGRVTSLN